MNDIHANSKNNNTKNNGGIITYNSELNSFSHVRYIVHHIDRHILRFGMNEGWSTGCVTEYSVGMRNYVTR